MYTASVWDYDRGERVQFESKQPCCNSCIEESAYGEYFDDHCCCIHAMEYEVISRKEE